MPTDIDHIYLISIGILICFSAIFSCCETSITAVSRAKIHLLKSQGNKKAALIDKFLENREKVISAMLVGNNAVNILASALAASLAIKHYGEAGLFYATIIMTLVVLIFAEIMPKTFAIKAPVKMLMIFLPIIWLVVNFFYPLTHLIQRFVNKFVGLFFGKKHKNSKLEELEEIRSAVELKAIEGTIVKKDKDLIEGVLDLADTDISEIMVYRKDIESIDVNQDKEFIIKAALESKFSKIPLWCDEKENIISILNTKKLAKEIYDLQANNQEIYELDLNKICNEPIFTPMTNSLEEQLDEFRKNRSKFALVIDEYGALQGLITAQDIIEEIIGEMKDQDDALGQKITKTRSGFYKISAKMLIRDINRNLDWDLEESDEAYNINAFIINKLGRIPQINENFVIGDYQFEVFRRNEFELEQLKIKKINQ